MNFDAKIQNFSHFCKFPQQNLPTLSPFHRDLFVFQYFNVRFRVFLSAASTLYIIFHTSSLDFLLPLDLILFDDLHFVHHTRSIIDPFPIRFRTYPRLLSIPHPNHSPCSPLPFAPFVPFAHIFVVTLLSLLTLFVPNFAMAVLAVWQFQIIPCRCVALSLL